VPRFVDRGRAIGDYGGTLRAIIHALKYDRRRSIAPRLAALMRERGADLLDGADLVVPVPLHWRRRRSRGFNQAADLAAHLGLPVRHALRRTRWTRPQVELPAAQRHRNLRGAFAVVARPNARGLSWAGWLASETARERIRRRRRRAAADRTRGNPETRDWLNGRCVLLVDDVSTTGATLDACARVLKAAGAREVRSLTAARVVSQRR